MQRDVGELLELEEPVTADGGVARRDLLERAVVAGPLCTPLDTLARAAELPPLAAGGLVAVMQSGAYGLTASPAGFLSHGMPVEVLVDNGTAAAI